MSLLATEIREAPKRSVPGFSVCSPAWSSSNVHRPGIVIPVRRYIQQVNAEINCSARPTSSLCEASVSVSAFVAQRHTAHKTSVDPRQRERARQKQEEENDKNIETGNPPFDQHPMGRYSGRDPRGSVRLRAPSRHLSHLLLLGSMNRWGR